ncbi:hypothetical protein TWF718_009714 [Orbilia javanica]|uniref:DNA/RNA-binding domain-containing protein n=1 Tax=Orbilia javanica TaxID=47235 RepID=A0AAN8RAR0_9PEZI
MDQQIPDYSRSTNLASANAAAPGRRTKSTEPPLGSTSVAHPPPTLDPSESPTLILQLEGTPISGEELTSEIKRIYAGLVMVEAKCIEVVSKQDAATTEEIESSLNDAQWQGLCALHKTLLEEHYDFLLAIQKSSAEPSLRKLATKYCMPARMWRHGIHSFLELLTRHLPISYEHMLNFINFAYAIMALLYETVPMFANTWAECLGDLGRYYMVIANDRSDRKLWVYTSRSWYSTATNQQPGLGRLYHHSAILIHNDILKKLFSYYKALAAVEPFLPTRESILKTFESAASQENRSANTTFVLLHFICFTGVSQDVFAEKKRYFLGLLKMNSSKFKILGAYLAICGVASLFQYNRGNARMELATTGQENQKATTDAETAYEATMQGRKTGQKNLLPPDPVIDNYNPKDALLTRPPELDLDCSSPDISLIYAQELAFDILSIVFVDCEENPAVQPHIYVWLVFLSYLKHYPQGMALITKKFPWKQLVKYGTALLKKNNNDKEFLKRVQDNEAFPVIQDYSRPLPEEYIMRGLKIARRYFPYDYFSKFVPDDERLIELLSMGAVREEKILWLIIKLANYGPWIQYDPASYSFSVSNELAEILTPPTSC